MVGLFLFKNKYVFLIHEENFLNFTILATNFIWNWGSNILLGLVGIFGVVKKKRNTKSSKSKYHHCNFLHFDYFLDNLFRKQIPLVTNKPIIINCDDITHPTENQKLSIVVVWILCGGRQKQIFSGCCWSSILMDLDIFLRFNFFFDNSLILKSSIRFQKWYRIQNQNKWIIIDKSNGIAISSSLTLCSIIKHIRNYNMYLLITYIICYSDNIKSLHIFVAIVALLLDWHV